MGEADGIVVVGATDGSTVGAPEGLLVGRTEGAREGLWEGAPLGSPDGIDEGTLVEEFEVSQKVLLVELFSMPTR